jgi:uncharacterized protein (TIGR02118 family)
MFERTKSLSPFALATLLILALSFVAWGASGGATTETGGETSEETGTVYRLSAIYPQTADSTFDMDYYLSTHIPLVEELFQPLSVEVNEGVSGAEEGLAPPYAVMTDITFATLEDLQNAVATHGSEVVGDIPNFTNVEAQLQINRSSD